MHNLASCKSNKFIYAQKFCFHIRNSGIVIFTKKIPDFQGLFKWGNCLKSKSRLLNS
jgi:hypothetical protein